MLLPVMLIASRDFGITWDEGQHNTFARLIYEFYANGFDIGPIVHYYNTAQYGGFFELLAHLAQKLAAGMDPFDVRHTLNALFGWLGLLFAGLLGKRLFGVWGGLLSVVLLAVSPRYVAHSMNNPKDLPYAVFYLAGVYAFSFLRPHFPYVTKRAFAACILFPALAINVRVAGLLLICYFFVFVATYAFFERRVLSWKQIALLVLGGAAYGVATMMLGTVFWPWALLDPLVRPLQALGMMSHFSAGAGTSIDFVLFGGRMIPSYALPWDYIPRFMAITMPLAVLAALAFVPVLFCKAENRLRVWQVVFAAFFPLGYILVTQPRLYDGWRHLLFVYPLMAVLAAGVWVRGWKWCLSGGSRRKLLLPVFAALLVLGLYHPLLFQFREHPNQITYFNQLVGGTKGAFLHYDLDYWGNSYKQAVDWLRRRHGNGKKPVTFVADPAAHVPQLYANRFSDITFQFAQEPPDFILLLLRYSPADMVGILRDPAVVHVVAADGAPLCVIMKFPKE